MDAGRFDVKDLDVAVTMTAGALIALGQLVQNQPDRDVEQTTDRVTEDLLRMFGMPTRTAPSHLHVCRSPFSRPARLRARESSACDVANTDASSWRSWGLLTNSSLPRHPSVKGSPPG